MIRLFAKRLKKARLEKGLSQKELAFMVQVTAASMCNYENGIYLPPLKTAYAIAVVLDASLDYLTGLQGDEKYIKEPEVLWVAEEE